ncbi:MAG: hypothetical protein HY057_08565 [Rhodospirillales bacterium]|nr:hypothetical protein [Rhodospirillales bacterium]
MPKKQNPLNLNPLQLRTLTLLQALAALPDHSAPAEESGSVRVMNLPRPHGDHFHLGPYAVLARDATGLANEAAWVALERKGLIKSMFPMACVVTADGMAYDTGMKSAILHGSDH